MASHIHFTAHDKLKAIVNVSSAIFSSFGAVLDYETVRVNLSFTAYVKRAYTRTLLDLCTPLQLQWLSGSGSNAYRKWIKKHGQVEGMREKTDILGEDGAKLHWIGKEDAQKVILYLHGDGFVTPLNQKHITFMNNIRLRVKDRVNIDLRVAFLEYTLIPFAHFPTQLNQAAQAFRYLLNSNVSPSNILLAGDSSGGLLLFQLLSHLLHPHPSIEPISFPAANTISRSQLAGIFAISPWVSLDENRVEDNKVVGFHNHGIIDFVPVKVVNTWSSLMKQRGNATTSPKSEEPRSSTGKETASVAFQELNWEQPFNASAEWWHDTYKTTSHILITRGTKETMAEDIEHFGDELDKAIRGTKAGVKLFSETNGIHCSPILATILETNGTDFMKDIVEWVSEQFVKTQQR